MVLNFLKRKGSGNKNLMSILSNSHFGIQVA